MVEPAWQWPEVREALEHAPQDIAYLFERIARLNTAVVRLRTAVDHAEAEVERLRYVLSEAWDEAHCNCDRLRGGVHQTGCLMAKFDVLRDGDLDGVE